MKDNEQLLSFDMDIELPNQVSKLFSLQEDLLFISKIDSNPIKDKAKEIFFSKKQKKSSGTFHLKHWIANLRLRYGLTAQDCPSQCACYTVCCQTQCCVSWTIGLTGTPVDYIK